MWSQALGSVLPILSYLMFIISPRRKAANMELLSGPTSHLLELCPEMQQAQIRTSQPPQLRSRLNPSAHPSSLSPALREELEAEATAFSPLPGASW